MANSSIASSRFKWKKQAWRDPNNVEALWVFYEKGDIVFCFQLKKGIKVPEGYLFKIKRPKYKLDDLSFVPISDPQVIDDLKYKTRNLTVCGARSRALILGEIELNVFGKTRKLLVFTTLKDWRKIEEALL